MEHTRRLDGQTKLRLKEFCDQILFNQVYKNGGDSDFTTSKNAIIKDLKAHHHSNINLFKIDSIRDLEQRLNDHSKELLKMYQMSSEKIDWSKAETSETKAFRQKVFLNYYDGMIEEAKRHVGSDNNENEDQKSKHFEHEGNDKSQDDISLGVGTNRGMLSPKSDHETAESFFLRLVSSIFKNINFYNLLYEQR